MSSFSAQTARMLVPVDDPDDLGPELLALVQILADIAKESIANSCSDDITEPSESASDNPRKP